MSSNRLIGFSCASRAQHWQVFASALRCVYKLRAELGATCAGDPPRLVVWHAQIREAKLGI